MDQDRSMSLNKQSVRDTTLRSIMNSKANEESLAFKPVISAFNQKFVDTDIEDIQISDIVFSKLTQIQHDMLSFDVPAQQIRQVVSKFMKSSNLIPPEFAQQVEMQL